MAATMAVGVARMRGAGAGHDEDGDGAQPVASEEESQRGGQQEGGQEVAGKAVGEALDGGLAEAGFLDQAGDAGERGVVAGARDADAKKAVTVERAGEDLGAGVLVGGKRLAGDGAFIDAGRALHDHAVGRDALAGAHQDDVAGLQGGGIDLDLLAVADQARTAGELLDEAGDGGAGASGGIGLQALAH